MVRSTALRCGLGAAALLLTVTGCAAGQGFNGYAKNAVDAGRFPVLDPDRDEPAVSADKKAAALARDVILRAADWHLDLDPDDGDESDTLETLRFDDECEAEYLGLPEGTPAAIGRWYALPAEDAAEGSVDPYRYVVASAVTVHHGPLAAGVDFGFARDAADRCGIYYIGDDLRIDGVERIALPGGEGYDDVVAEHGVRSERMSPGNTDLSRYVEAVARKGRIVVTVSAQAPYDAAQSTTVSGSKVDEELRGRVSDALVLMLERLRERGE